MRPDADRLTIPPPARTFAERAHQLVEFLAESSGNVPGSACRVEQELADWIGRWQQLAPTTHEFLAIELGIIVRALNGPPASMTLSHHDALRHDVHRGRAQP